MLTGHECIRMLAELRAATPLVRYSWPHTPVAADFKVGRLSIVVSGPSRGAEWSGWAMLDNDVDNTQIWPPHLSERFHDEVDAALKRAGIDAVVWRPMSCGMPF